MTDLMHTTNADASLLSAFALPQYIREILSRFDAAGYEAFCVGGCVRDILRGVVPHDWDLCTAALPEQTLSLFSDKPCLTVGIKHGTVTVLWDQIPVEITTYRCEQAYIGHRAPSSVTFTPSLHEDCLRRDFTINAMAYHPTMGLRDDFGGVGDMRNGLLRCVGNPAERFDEDALRIMRALRFAAVLCFQIDAETAAALHTCAPLLQYISGERILSEFRQMLMGANAPVILSEFADVVGVFYPPLAACRGQETRITGLFQRCQTAQTRLAALLCLCGCTDADTARKTVSRLPAERRFIDSVTALAADAAKKPPATRAEMRRRMSTESVGQITEQLSLHAALFADRAAACDAAAVLCHEVAAAGDVTRIAHLAVNGRDLAAYRLRGSAIGEALQMLLDAVIDGKTENTRAALLAYLDVHMQK